MGLHRQRQLFVWVVLGFTLLSILSALPSALATGPLTIDDSVQGLGPNQLNYIGQGWQHCTNCGPTFYNKSKSWTTTAGDSLNFLFSGTQLKLYGGVNTAGGQASVSIDGQAATTIDFYAPTAKGDALLWTSPVLADGPHNFLLRVLKTHQAKSQGTGVVLDRVDISTSSTPPSGKGAAPSPTPCVAQPTKTPRLAPTFIPKKDSKGASSQNGSPKATQSPATAAPTTALSASNPCGSASSALTPLQAASSGIDPIYIATNFQLGRTTNFSDASPHWENITPQINGGIGEFVLDPYHPHQNAIVVNGNGVWITHNIEDPAPTWTQTLTSSKVGSDYAQAVNNGFCVAYGPVSIAANPARDGGFVLTIQTDNPASLPFARCPSMAYVTTDAGATWTYKIMPNCPATWACLWNAPVPPSFGSDGVVRIFPYKYDSQQQCAPLEIYTSTDGGDNWTGPIAYLPNLCPGNDSAVQAYTSSVDSNVEFLLTEQHGFGGGNFSFRTTDGWSTSGGRQSLTVSTDGTTSYSFIFPGNQQRSMVGFKGSGTTDTLYIGAISASDGRAVFLVSHDTGATWSVDGAWPSLEAGLSSYAIFPFGPSIRMAVSNGFGTDWLQQHYPGCMQGGECPAIVQGTTTGGLSQADWSRKTGDWLSASNTFGSSFGSRAIITSASFSSNTPPPPTPTPSVTPTPTVTPSPTPILPSGTAPNAPLFSTSHYVSTTDPMALRQAGCDTAKRNADGSSVPAENALIVLDFGIPEVKDGVYGARSMAQDGADHFYPVLPRAIGNQLPSDLLTSTEKNVATAVVNFMQGYWNYWSGKCPNETSAPPSTEWHVTLVVGTNDDQKAAVAYNIFVLDRYAPNSTYPTISAHARAWANMIVAIDQFASPLFSDRFTVASGMDIEGPWAAVDQAKAWVDSFLTATQDHSKIRFYNYGTMDCPNTNGPEGNPVIHCVQESPLALRPTSYPDDPYLDKWYYVAYGAERTLPIPEIYNASYGNVAGTAWAKFGGNAFAWYRLSRYGALCQQPCLTNSALKKRKILFPGVMTTYQADQRTNCPRNGWQQLFMTINADPDTRLWDPNNQNSQPKPQPSFAPGAWSTDIKWDPVPLPYANLVTPTPAPAPIPMNCIALP